MSYMMNMSWKSLGKRSAPGNPAPPPFSTDHQGQIKNTPKAQLFTAQRFFVLGLTQITQLAGEFRPGPGTLVPAEVDTNSSSDHSMRIPVVFVVFNFRLRIHFQYGLDPAV